MTDRLLDMSEISAKLRMPMATVRYKRHRGELPFTSAIETLRLQPETS